MTQVLEPGDTIVCTLTVRNFRAKATAFTIESFAVTGSRSGGTKTVSQDDPDAKDSAAAWIDPAVGKVTLKPMQIAEIPKQPGADVPNVGVQVGAGVPLFLRVGGAGKPKLSFHEPRAPKLRVDRAAWTWRARVDNDGTQQAAPRGKLRVKSILGGTVASFDLATQTLLPGGGERVEATWKRTPWIGIYKYDARVDAQGDSSATSARASGWIFVVPPWWITILAVVLLVLAALVPYIRKQREYRAYLGDVEEHLFDDEHSEPPKPPRID